MYLEFARELRQQWNIKVTVILIVIGALGTVTKGLQRGLEDLKFGGEIETIVNIDQNTEKSPGEPRGLYATQTPVRDDQLTLV